MKFEYETSRLMLRVLCTSEAPFVTDFVANNKEDFDKYEPLHPKNFYTEQCQYSILDSEYNAFLNQRFIRYYVFKKENPFKIIGTVSYSHIRYAPYYSVILGYKFDKEYRRMGYATEAVKRANQAVFEELKIHRIECSIMPENEPSIRFIENLGFKKEGYLEKAIEIQGEFKDHILYSLLDPRSK